VGGWGGGVAAVMNRFLWRVLSLSVANQMSLMSLFSTNQLPPLLYSLLFGGQRNLGVDLPQQQHLRAGAGLVNAVGGGRQRHVQLVG
jgi:hypothetical protein